LRSRRWPNNRRRNRYRLNDGRYYWLRCRRGNRLYWLNRRRNGHRLNNGRYHRLGDRYWRGNRLYWLDRRLSDRRRNRHRLNDGWYRRLGDRRWRRNGDRLNNRLFYRRRGIINYRSIGGTMNGDRLCLMGIDINNHRGTGLGCLPCFQSYDPCHNFRVNEGRGSLGRRLPRFLPCFQSYDSCHNFRVNERGGSLGRRLNDIYWSHWNYWGHWNYWRRSIINRWDWPVLLDNLRRYNKVRLSNSGKGRYHRLNMFHHGCRGFFKKRPNDHRCGDA